MIHPKTLQRMRDELIAAGIEEDEARERANNIGQVILMTEETDRDDVAHMLEPRSGFRGGIADEKKRLVAASRCLAAYVVDLLGSDRSKEIGLQMWCGMSEIEASAYINEVQTARIDAVRAR